MEETFDENEVDIVGETKEVEINLDGVNNVEYKDKKSLEPMIPYNRKYWSNRNRWNDWYFL